MDQEIFTYLRETIERSPLSYRKIAAESHVSLNTIRKLRDGETIHHSPAARLCDFLGWPDPEPTMPERLEAAEEAIRDLTERVQQLEDAN